MTKGFLPFNLAHRGARKVAPENTLSAFLKARELGADGVELDVFCCATGELVVTHDDELSIWSNGKGRVTETPLKALKELDFGAHFSPQFSGEPIPALQEVIDQLDTEQFINIEVKTLSLRPMIDAEAVVKIIQRNNLYHRVLVSSFNPLVLHQIKKRDKEIDTGLLFQFRLPLYSRRPFTAPLLKLQALHPEQHLVNERFVAYARQRGYLINCWTVNDADEMRRLIDLGVDAIITDYPDLLHKVCAEYQERYSFPPPTRRKMSRIGFQ